MKEDLSGEIKLVKELTRVLSVFKGPPGGSDRSVGHGREADGDEGGRGEEAEGRWSPPPPKDRGLSGRSSLAPATRKVGPVPVSGGREAPAWEQRALKAGGVGSGNGAVNVLDALGRRVGVVKATEKSVGGRINMKAPLPAAALGRGGKRGGPPSSGRVASGGQASSRAPPPLSNAQDPSLNGDGNQGDGQDALPSVRPFAEVQRGLGRGIDADLIENLEREIVDFSPNVKWGDIAGLDDAKGVLQEAVVLPLMCPGFFSGIRKPWKGVLLYGPPGTGKTLLAKAVATECRTRFFDVSPSSLASKWRGDAEKMVRLLFDMAQHYAPTVLFFDEVDALASKRFVPHPTPLCYTPILVLSVLTNPLQFPPILFRNEGEHEASRRMKTEMLTCMDGMANKAASITHEETDGEGEGESGQSPANKMVMVLGATNQPWELDDAFKRRFEKRIYIPLPGAPERVTLFRLLLNTLILGSDVDFSKLAELTSNYSGADIAVVAKHASYAPMRRKQAALALAYPKPDQIREKIIALKACEAEVSSSPIVMADFVEAVASNKPSASHEGLAKFVAYSKEHGAT